jgi:3-deoxy-D-arabino-heptulosonate 7-phosphate (DAHP) synthase class II
MQELTYFRTHMDNHSLPSGMSLEATFEDVLECFGGAYPLEEEQLKI